MSLPVCRASLTEAENLERKIEHPNTPGTAHSYALPVCRASLAEAENLEREIEQPNTPGTAYRPPPRTKEIVVSSFFHIFFTTSFRTFLWAGVVGYHFAQFCLFSH
jgi:hypothetical protein